MEYETTRKAVLNGFPRVYSVGYCGLQNLLHFCSRSAYTHGIYGWNADVYDFGRIAIVTGYRPFGSATPAGLCTKYEKEAETVLHDYTIPYDERKQKIRHLLDSFITELKIESK